MYVQTKLWSGYFKVLENRTSLWNVHRALNVSAFLIALVGMIVVLTTKEFANAVDKAQSSDGGAERHVIYAFALIAAAVLQVVGAATLPHVSDWRDGRR